MAEAADRLRAGLLVAFPTETVYGLGGNALDSDAVARIFAAKGRPPSNPLIVHVADVGAARALAAEWPAAAETLANAFWPGPLTLVVRKTDDVRADVTAGGLTVGLRVPAHPVALELLRLGGVPIAAPSANRSEEISPTTAGHVADSLGPWVDDLLILDGGPTRIGIESTVVDVTGVFSILRPGMLDHARLAAALGPLGANAFGNAKTAGSARSPGQRARHYAPRTPTVLIPGDRIARELAPTDGLLTRGKPEPSWHARVTIELPRDADGYAARLYAALRYMDIGRVTRIVVQALPEGPEWAAIRDRLSRASAVPGGERQNA